jgi:ribonuclease BN (tRNA processing enzyme)
MRLEVLGFRVGAPLGAACPGYVVHAESATLLLDCGPGVLERLWARGLAGRLDAIVLSHMHMDHVLDLLPLSGEITRMALGEPARPALWVPRGRGPEALAGLAEAVGSDYARFGEAFELGEYDDGDELAIGDLGLTFAPTAHAQPCYAARVIEGDSTLVYGADGALSESLLTHAEGADVLLLEATFADESPELEAAGHMTGAQAAEVADRAGAKRLLLTHTGPWPNDDNLRHARERFAAVELVTEGAVYDV